MTVVRELSEIQPQCRSYMCAHGEAEMDIVKIQPNPSHQVQDPTQFNPLYTVYYQMYLVPYPICSSLYNETITEIQALV